MLGDVKSGVGSRALSLCIRAAAQTCCLVEGYLLIRLFLCTEGFIDRHNGSSSKSLPGELDWSLGVVVYLGKMADLRSFLSVCLHHLDLSCTGTILVSLQRL